LWPVFLFGAVGRWDAAQALPCSQAATRDQAQRSGRGRLGRRLAVLLMDDLTTDGGSKLAFARGRRSVGAIVEHPPYLSRRVPRSRFTPHGGRRDAAFWRPGQMCRAPTRRSISPYGSCRDQTVSD
jgi:hypothetical protein